MSGRKPGEGDVGMLGRERPGSRCRPLCCGMDWLQVPEVLGCIWSAAKRFPKECAHCDIRARSGDSASGVEATAPGRPAPGRTRAGRGPRGARPLRCGQRPGPGREPFQGGTLPRRGVAARGLRWRGLGGLHKAQLGQAEERVTSRLRVVRRAEDGAADRSNPGRLGNGPDSQRLARQPLGEPKVEACLERCNPEFARPAALVWPSSRLAQVLRQPSRRGEAGTGGHSCDRRVGRRASGTRGRAGLRALGAGAGERSRERGGLAYLQRLDARVCPRASGASGPCPPRGVRVAEKGGGLLGDRRDLPRVPLAAHARLGAEAEEAGAAPGGQACSRAACGSSRRPRPGRVEPSARRRPGRVPRQGSHGCAFRGLAKEAKDGGRAERLPRAGEPTGGGGATPHGKGGWERPGASDGGRGESGVVPRS